jgi:predicted metalloprotease with PDZ domain
MVSAYSRLAKLLFAFDSNGDTRYDYICKREGEGLIVRLVWFCILAMAATALDAKTYGNDQVQLSFRPVMKPGGHDFAAMDVSLQFRGDADGLSEVDLPNEWGGLTKLYQYLSEFKAQGGKLEQGALPHQIVIRHRPNARLTLSYRVTGALRPDALVQGEDANEYRPIINPSYFHLVGNVVVAQPEHLSGNVPARFELIGLPQGKAWASDMEHDRFGRHLVFTDLIESVTAGGDFRIINAGNGARLAIRGKIDQRDDADWVKSFGAVSAAITAYWQDEAGPYLVTILPFASSGEGYTSLGGTGRADAFAFFSSTNADPDTIDVILAHEMGHSWVPRKLGNMANGPDEPKQYWFSEGFTDFTTWRALVRAGFWTPERFATQWNGALAEYDRLPVREISNDEAAKLFWTSAEGQRLPYLRGMLFASWLDDQLRRLNKPTSLRKLLLAMQAEVKPLDWQQIEKRGHGVGLLLATASVAGLPLDDAIATYIDAGKAISFDPSSMSECGQFESRQRRAFHRGFDVQATLANDNVVSGVIVDGPAWKAGLRDGMKLVRRSGGEIGNSEVEIAYDVQEAGVAKTLRWMPEGEGQETFRRLVLDTSKEADCKNYLSN